MRLTGYKKLIVALLLMAFTSQSIAALAMSCQLSSQAQPSAEQTMMAGMNHSKMDMDGSMDMMGEHSMPPRSDQKAGCCKAIGHCSLGNCSLISVTNAFAISLAAVSSAAVDSYTSVQPLPLVSSLYRPPIFR